MKIPKLPDDKLRKLAVDFSEGKIFTDRHVKNTNDISGVFMPIALGAFADCDKEYLEDIGLIYEELGKAGPLAVNGMPTFFSCRLLGKEQTNQLSAMVDKLREAKKEFLTPKP